MSHHSIVIFTGGHNGARLAQGLALILPPEQLTIIVNTSDNFEHLGLHIFPDLDKVSYTLAGLTFSGGKVIKNESWNMMASLARYRGPTWYQLGDRDLAAQLLRSNWLHEGYPLNWITQELAKRLGVRHTILPMSEDPIRTVVQTAKGEMGLYEYLAQKQPLDVTGLDYKDAAQAEPSREVMNAIREADAIIFGPGNPATTLGPMLAMPNLHRILAAGRAPKIAVTRQVNESTNEAMTNIMAAANIENSPVGTAQYLHDILTGCVIDIADEAYQDPLTDMGLRTLATNYQADQKQLAQDVLDFAKI